MRTYKLVDCWIQAILILAGLLFALSGYQFDSLFFGAYFTVGGWQIMSVILHRIFYTPQHKSLMRRIYLVTLITVVALLLISLPSDFVIVALYGLLFFSPLMAVYYLITCIVETKRLTVLQSSEAAA